MQPHPLVHSRVSNSGADYGIVCTSIKKPIGAWPAMLTCRPVENRNNEGVILFFYSIEVSDHSADAAQSAFVHHDLTGDRAEIVITEYRAVLFA